MKQVISVFAFLLGLNYLLTAQIQREFKSQSDSTSRNESNERDGFDKEKMISKLKELNLSENQKVQIKQLKESLKEQKDVITNDANFSDTEKQEKLKNLRIDHLKRFQSILTKEQKQKLRKMRKEKGKKKNEDTIE